MPSTSYQPGIRDTINDCFARTLVKRPDEIFVDMEGDQLTFREFDRRVDLYARGLRDAGIAKGDTVCALTDTSMDILVMWFATNRLGAIWVPINSALKGEFLRHQIEDSKATMMIVDPGYLSRIAAVEDQLKTLRRVFVRGGAAGESLGRMSVEPLGALVENPGPELERVSVAPADPALIIYTSGTTGVSKGCLCSHNYLCNYGREMAWATGLEEGDRLWFALPLFHIGGMGGGVINALTTGARAVIARTFSVTNFWPEAERSGANVLIGVGVMMEFLVNAPDDDAMMRCRGQVKTMCAAPMSLATQEAARRRFGIRTVGAPGYGNTEASFPVLHPLAEQAPAGTSGRRFEDFQVRIVDDAGGECPPGEPGMILVKPNYPNIMFEQYWHNPEATSAALVDGWFNTGDVGKFNAEGFFVFLDRKKDYLRRRGENISSFEVETALLAHPAIAEVAVHAVSHEFSEDELKATIVLAEGSAASERDLCIWSIDRLPHFAVPRFIEFREALPKNPIGRVLKFQLREEGVTSRTWDRTSDPNN